MLAQLLIDNLYPETPSLTLFSHGLLLLPENAFINPTGSTARVAIASHSITRNAVSERCAVHEGFHETVKLWADVGLSFDLFAWVVGIVLGSSLGLDHLGNHLMTKADVEKLLARVVKGGSRVCKLFNHPFSISGR